MSSQKFNAAQREALWLAHQRKCAYTRQLIDVSSFHIDHIIPEDLDKDPVEFQKVKAKLGLSDDFDLFGYNNLLPCSPGANLQKGSLLFDPAPIHYFLAMASSQRMKVEAHLEHIEKRKSRGKALILLQQCLDCGELSSEEVAQILENYSSQPEEIFLLLERMQFADAPEVKAIAKADIEELRKRQIKLGKNNHIDGVTLTSKDSWSVQIHVRTCQEYEVAIKAGYYARTTFDMKMAVFFEHQCGLLKSLQAALTPERSFIAEPRVGIVDLELLPFSLFPSLGEQSPDLAPTDTYQEKIDSGILVVKHLRQNMVCVETAGMRQKLTEIARADFNGDGTEDILLFHSYQVIGGSFGSGGILILTRKTPDGLFEKIA
jgi:hypothetical protein